MLILILIGIVPSMITAYLVVRSYEERAVSLRMVNVRNQCEILCNSLVAEQYFSNPGSEVINSQLILPESFAATQMRSVLLRSLTFSREDTMTASIIFRLLQPLSS